jgi:hypothetical protein
VFSNYLKFWTREEIHKLGYSERYVPIGGTFEILLIDVPPHIL